MATVYPIKHRFRKKNKNVGEQKHEQIFSRTNLDKHNIFILWQNEKKNLIIPNGNLLLCLCKYMTHKSIMRVNRGRRLESDCAFYYFSRVLVLEHDSVQLYHLSKIKQFLFLHF